MEKRATTGHDIVARERELKKKYPGTNARNAYLVAIGYKSESELNKSKK